MKKFKLVKVPGAIFMKKKITEEYELFKNGDKYEVANKGDLVVKDSKGYFAILDTEEGKKGVQGYIDDRKDKKEFEDVLFTDDSGFTNYKIKDKVFILELIPEDMIVKELYKDKDGKECERKIIVEAGGYAAYLESSKGIFTFTNYLSGDTFIKGLELDEIVQVSEVESEAIEFAINKFDTANGN